MKKSAGILAYRFKDNSLQCFLVHPGGPFFVRKDEGVWSIPKGEFTVEEPPLLAAQREFFEETGVKINGDFIELKPVKLKSGKVVYAFGIETDFDASKIMSNEFTMEWPVKSGKFKSFPEVDRGEWFELDVARKKISPGQVPLLDELYVRFSN
jgi:predicted NUDIX family NTP pyrophosphohydrolase